jgi:hypothetical protein
MIAVTHKTVHLTLDTDYQAKQYLHVQTFIWSSSEGHCITHHPSHAAAFARLKSILPTRSFLLCVCGEVTFKSQIRNVTPLNKNIMSFIYLFIYRVKCITLLTGCKNGSRHLPCALPWTEPTDHSPDTLGTTCQSRHGDTPEFTIRNKTR